MKPRDPADTIQTGHITGAGIAVGAGAVANVINVHFGGAIPTLDLHALLSRGRRWLTLLKPPPRGRRPRGRGLQARGQRMRASGKKAGDESFERRGGGAEECAH